MGNQLSGGEQQMLAIGRALMTNPRLLILDEATEGLAPLIRAEIWRCVSQPEGEGQSILVIDKNLAALCSIADRHYIMEKGRVVWQGASRRAARQRGGAAPLSGSLTSRIVRLPSSGALRAPPSPTGTGKGPARSAGG